MSQYSAANGTSLSYLFKSWVCFLSLKAGLSLFPATRRILHKNNGNENTRKWQIFEAQPSKITEMRNI